MTATPIVSGWNGRRTNEEGQNSGRIKAKAKGLDPQEGDAGCCLKVTAGDVLLPSIAGNDSWNHVPKKQCNNDLHTYTGKVLSASQQYCLLECWAPICPDQYSNFIIFIVIVIVIVIISTSITIIISNVRSACAD